MTTFLTTAAPLIALDLVAIAVLVFGIYFPRHRRSDLVVAFLGVNIGVLAVAMSLASSAVSAGLGLGLFGVLSIIRLRSTEISQREVAYYFAALAIGLLTGMSSGVTVLLVVGLALVITVLALADSSLFAHYASGQVLLDSAIADQVQLREVLSQRLGTAVLSVSTVRLDYINDSTLVDVRYLTRKEN
ncbi:DUF4956 domain-containing protein [Buchananella hordeovulneris]|uniref:DUF4956 domain-containing protein n=1 Tax=Buchananella hordeovulneris TaxID=52770 RepID=UPI0026DDB0D1|nr:DUF4956 domain-containing protein [Buchananella hordeovulneris]MDO5080869.1 DUF4956 domain-containing protein [Buchananella hordeovulneris]